MHVLERPAGGGRRLNLAAKVAATASVVGVAAAALWGGGYAAWTTGGVQAQDISTADVSASFTDTGDNAFAVDVNGLLPGDYLYRYADLANTGDVAQSFTLAVASETGLLTAPADGLKVEVVSCSVAWDQATNTCGGTSTTELAQDYITDAGVSSAAFGLAVGAAQHLQVQLLLPDGADQATFSAKSDTIRVTASGSTRAGTDRSAG
jgi:hypothetical protein